ncbi:hypothetical protein ACFCW4_28620 [Streptomyces virginiae]|uniref:hypothetical protein n=1 Tax=Streptomyces virginiae TaxID=1961 RepID=UPI0035D936AB
MAAVFFAAAFFRFGISCTVAPPPARRGFAAALTGLCHRRLQRRHQATEMRLRPSASSTG